MSEQMISFFMNADTKLNHFSKDNIFSKKKLNVVANPDFHVTRCLPGVTWQNVWVGEQSNKEWHLNRKIILELH